MIPEDLKEEREKIRKLAKMERNKKRYEKSKAEKIRCDICKCEVDKYYYPTHCQTTRHKRWSELVANNVN